LARAGRKALAMESHDDTSTRLHVVIEGRVQGVGFRYATQRQAQALGLAGWVQNLPDGRVEALFEGARDDLERMRDWCEHGPAYARVSHVALTWEQGPAAHTSFRIRG
jgi:acylphosphatase